MTHDSMTRDAPIELFVTPTVEAFATVSLPADPLFHARLRKGEAIEGLIVEVAGDALLGRDIEALEVWVPYGDAAARWEVAPCGENSDAMRFELPAVVLEAPATRLDPEALRKLPVEIIEARLIEENRRSLAGSFRGRAREPVEGALKIRVRGEDPAGPTSAWCEVVVVVDPLPRRPILSDGSRLDVAGSSADVSTWALCDAHSGSDYAVAWFAFDEVDVLTEECFGDWVDRLVTAVLDGVDQPFLVGTLLRSGERRGASKSSVTIEDREGTLGPSWAESWSSLAVGAALRLD
ncbi:MAG: hypothetical protein KAI47_24755, partial [Deltaproteobacteria bacterium]|nr:hypothetical protein [Deltaproteobacteria bacterium]